MRPFAKSFRAHFIMCVYWVCLYISSDFKTCVYNRLMYVFLRVVNNTFKRYWQYQYQYNSQNAMPIPIPVKKKYCNTPAILKNVLAIFQYQYNIAILTTLVFFFERNDLSPKQREGDGLRRPSVDVDAFATSMACCDLDL